MAGICFYSLNLFLTGAVLYWRMVEVSNELIYTLMLEIQREVAATHADQQAIRDELANLNDTVRSLARSNVSIKRDVATLRDSVTILTVAVDEHPPAHVQPPTWESYRRNVSLSGAVLHWRHGRENGQPDAETTGRDARRDADRLWQG